MSTELDRLYTRLDDFFRLLSEHDKRLSSTETKIDSHLEVSEVRVSAYDEDIKNLKSATDKNTDFRIEHEAKTKGFGSFAKWLHWALTVILALIAIGGKFVKISHP